MTDTDRWWMRLDKTSYVRARLLCIPHAGAGPVAYARWPSLLGADETSIHAAQLPGRGARMREALLDDAHAIAEALAQSVRPLLDKPYFVFGHSLGALIAFELTRALRRAKAPLPLRLMVSGRAAPQLPSPTPHLHTLPQEQFFAELRRRYGIADAALDDPEMAALMGPILRADIAAVERYSLAEEPPLSLPIDVFAGRDDPAIGPDSLAGWQDHTGASLRRRSFDGGHFYWVEQPDALLARIRRSMEADLNGW